jgi:hypothetical protein
MSGFCSCSAASFFCCCWSHDLMDCSAFLVTELSLCGLVSLACLARQPCLHSHLYSLSLRLVELATHERYNVYCIRKLSCEKMTLLLTTPPIVGTIQIQFARGYGIERIPVVVGLCSDRRHKEIVIIAMRFGFIGMFGASALLALALACLARQPCLHSHLYSLSLRLVELATHERYNVYCIRRILLEQYKSNSREDME